MPKLASDTSGESTYSKVKRAFDKSRELDNKKAHERREARLTKFIEQRNSICDNYISYMVKTLPSMKDMGVTSTKLKSTDKLYMGKDINCTPAIFDMPCYLKIKEHFRTRYDIPVMQNNSFTQIIFNPETLKYIVSIKTDDYFIKEYAKSTHANITTLNERAVRATYEKFMPYDFK